MARKANMTRTALVDRLTTCFLDAGYEGASLSRLSEATGLAKATLYHHFPHGKTDMGAAVLARIGQRLQVAILNPLEDETLPPKESISLFLDGVLIFYDGDIPACTLNTLLMGDGRELFAPVIQDGFNVWTRTLQAVLDRMEVSESAELVIDRIQGALVRCRAAGNRTPLEETVAAMRAHLLS